MDAENLRAFTQIRLYPRLHLIKSAVAAAHFNRSFSVIGEWGRRIEGINRTRELQKLGRQLAYGNPGADATSNS